MALSGKHVVAPVDGIRCTVVETGVSSSRAAFLQEMLTHNGYTVHAGKETDKEGNETGNWTVGVTDLLFNPVIALYQQKLFRPDGKVVTPAWWEQKTADTNIPYWQVSR